MRGPYTREFWFGILLGRLSLDLDDEMRLVMA